MTWNNLNCGITADKREPKENQLLIPLSGEVLTTQRFLNENYLYCHLIYSLKVC